MDEEIALGLVQEAVEKERARCLAAVDSVAKRAEKLKDDPLTAAMGQMIEITCEAIRKAVTGERNRWMRKLRKRLKRGSANTFPNTKK